MNENLNRFVDAQAEYFETAQAEIRAGKKRSHWMWFIFPQVAGLGYSETSKFYAIRDIHEAQAYLDHPVLGARLQAIAGDLLLPGSHDATAIFGSPDDLKLKSSMTLFSELPDAPAVFRAVLQKYFRGEKDGQTLAILKKR